MISQNMFATKVRISFMQKELFNFKYKSLCIKMAKDICINSKFYA